MLWSVKEAARKLNISSRAVYRLIEAGEIPAEQTIRGFTLIRPEDQDGLEIDPAELIALVRAKRQHKLTSPGQHAQSLTSDGQKEEQPCLASSKCETNA